MGTPDLARDSAGEERNGSSSYLPEDDCKQQKPFGKVPEGFVNLFLVFGNLSEAFVNLTKPSDNLPEALVNLLEASDKLTKGSNKLLSCSDRLPKLLFCFKTAFFFLAVPP
ncbi:MAG: hypothetical protein ICV79_22665, partial [Flavisolibacter sp.]|nr:hypothetical protein [Flavisolibacter sp.]